MQWAKAVKKLSSRQGFKCGTIAMMFGEVGNRYQIMRQLRNKQDIGSPLGQLFAILSRTCSTISGIFIPQPVPAQPSWLCFSSIPHSNFLGLSACQPRWVLSSVATSLNWCSINSVIFVVPSYCSVCRLLFHTIQMCSYTAYFCCAVHRSLCLSENPSLTQRFSFESSYLAGLSELLTMALTLRLLK